MPNDHPKTCGRCKWGKLVKTVIYQRIDCSAPIPQSAMDSSKIDMYPSDDATDCPCFEEAKK